MKLRVFQIVVIIFTPIGTFLCYQHLTPDRLTSEPERALIYASETVAHFDRNYSKENLGSNLFVIERIDGLTLSYRLLNSYFGTCISGMIDYDSVEKERFYFAADLWNGNLVFLDQYGKVEFYENPFCEFTNIPELVEIFQQKK